MTKRHHRLSMPVALLLAASVLFAPHYLTPAIALAQDGDVNVYEYAVDNPVGDSQLSIAPTLGETVPSAISLVPLDGNATYAYFYYNGQPVIVDLTTRSVVRVGQ